MSRKGTSQDEQALIALLSSGQTGSVRDRATESDIHHHCRAAWRRSTSDPTRRPIQQMQSIGRELTICTPGAIPAPGKEGLAFGSSEATSTGRSAHFALDRNSENVPANRRERKPDTL